MLAFTAPFNNMRILKVKAQPINVFFVTVNLKFGGSSQLSTSAECVRVIIVRQFRHRNSARQKSKAERSRRTLVGRLRKTQLSVEL